MYMYIYIYIYICVQSCGFDDQQRVLKGFPGPGYIYSEEDGVV